jgi:hypothetical protein
MTHQWTSLQTRKRNPALAGVSAMELAGLEPATSWVRYRPNRVASGKFGSVEPCAMRSDHPRFAQFGSTDGRSRSSRAGAPSTSSTCSSADELAPSSGVDRQCSLPPLADERLGLAMSFEGSSRQNASGRSPLAGAGADTVTSAGTKRRGPCPRQGGTPGIRSAPRRSRGSLSSRTRPPGLLRAGARAQAGQRLGSAPRPTASP